MSDIKHNDVPDMGHDADGIRELDNFLPRWWLWLFYITIIEKAGEQRIPVDLKMLPLTIGTAPKHARDITIHPDRSVGAGIESFTSGEHLEIIEYNPATQLLYVHNKGRNGTYEGGIRLSDRFTLKLAGKKLLSLGGPEGEEGVAQLRIDAA